MIRRGSGMVLVTHNDAAFIGFGYGRSVAQERTHYRPIDLGQQV
jgi:hypothetical protein